MILTLLLIGLGNIIFGSLALVLFAAAIVTASKTAGISGGIISVVLSTLACDFFFLPPIFSLNFDQATWTLAAKYAAIAVLSYALFPQRREGAVQPASSVLPGSGYVDGVIDGELFGWAIDPDNPAEPARVTAHVNERPVAEALAVYYRSDIAEAFNCSGSHGFFLNLSEVYEAEMDATVDVRLSNGESLGGAPLFAHLPSRKRSSAPTLLFMHIPKTAGTALRESILNNYRESEIAYIYPDAPGFPLRNLRDLPLQQRAQLRFVVGHFQYGIHNEIPNDYLYFTIVRDPVARVWSHYHHLVEIKDPCVIRDGKPKTLRQVLEARLTANLDNLMVRCFSGLTEVECPPGSIDGEVYELAKLHLEKAFVYVGQQERLGGAYWFLQSKLGWKRNLPLESINRRSYSSRKQADEELIRRFNTWDIKLYDQVFKLFP
ncbi:MAG: DUF4118 domain-containing protein [Bryobacteraceae bacterium]